MAQVFGLQVAHRLQHLGGDELELVADAAHGFQGVQQQRRSGAQRIGGLAGDHGAVRQRQSAGHRAALLRLF